MPSKKVIITKAQLNAIIEMTNDISAMIGVGEETDITWRKYVMLVDKFLNKNGYKRKFN